MRRKLGSPVPKRKLRMGRGEDFFFLLPFAITQIWSGYLLLVFDSRSHVALDLLREGP